MKEKKLKICMLIPSYFPLAGGAEIQLHGLANKLDPVKFEPFILTRRLPSTPPEANDERTIVIRKRAPLSPSTFFLSSLLFLIRHRKMFDVLHVHSFDSPALTGAVLKRIFPKKILIIKVPRYGDGSAFSRLENTFLGRKRLNFILKAADAVIPLNLEVMQALIRLDFPEEKIARIPNGVDTDLFKPPSPKGKSSIRNSAGLPETSFIAVTASRLIERKNIIGILRAWQTVVKINPSAVLLIIGTGPEEDNLKRFSEFFLPEGSVRFAGEASRRKVARLMSASDVFISFSASEGMSNSMLEASASGLPLIAMKGPGIDQMIRHGVNGFLIDPGSPNEAAEMIRTFSDNSDLLERMSRSAREFIMKHYSFHVVADKMGALYLEGPAADASSPIKSRPHRAGDADKTREKLEV